MENIGWSNGTLGLTWKGDILDDVGSKLDESEEQQQQVDDECDDHVRAYVRVLHVGFDNGKYITYEEIFCCFQRNKKWSFCHRPNSLSPSVKYQVGSLPQTFEAIMNRRIISVV